MNADEIIKVLNDLCDKFGIAMDWGSKNVLPYLQELGNNIVAYELWTSIAWIILLMLPIIVLFSFSKYYTKHKNEDFFKGCDDDDVLGYTYALMIFASIAWLTMSVIQVFDIITCLTFPEKIILEYCMDIYNSYGN